MRVCVTACCAEQRRNGTESVWNEHRERRRSVVTLDTTAHWDAFSVPPLVRHCCAHLGFVPRLRIELNGWLTRFVADFYLTFVSIVLFIFRRDCCTKRSKSENLTVHKTSRSLFSNLLFPHKYFATRLGYMFLILNLYSETVSNRTTFLLAQRIIIVFRDDVLIIQYLGA